MPVKDLSCSVEVEVAQPRKNVRLQKKSRILPVDTLMSCDVDGNATDQLTSIKSELEVQEEEEDDEMIEKAIEARIDGAACALNDLSFKNTPRTIESSDADNSREVDTRKSILADERVPSQRSPGDAISNVTDRPPTIVCPSSSSSYYSSPQGSPGIRRTLSKESENSFGNQDDNRHLNEYEVLGEIGKVGSSLFTLESSFEISCQAILYLTSFPCLVTSRNIWRVVERDRKRAFVKNGDLL